MKNLPSRAAAVGCLSLATSLLAQVAPTPNSTPSASDTVKLDEFIVTGVFTATSKEQASVSISTIDVGAIQAQVPVSGADLLKNVPGVYVNSTLGEIRNVVYSRGVSANVVAGNGYYYVSLQEDGLPITNVNFGNFGPDYFHRPDATLFRVEAVRGGTASVTAANAPGGVFNYISRTGTAEFGGEVRGRVGFEGDWFPFYRSDVSVGGPIGDSGWVYNAGGFFRRSHGSRDPGYAMNDGGQIKANLFKDYGNGSVKIYLKYLNDNNGWYEFTPAKNPQDPEIPANVDPYGTNLHRIVNFQFPRGAADKFDTFDSESLVHSQQRVVGVDWKHEFDGGWSFNNNVKVSRSQTDWNTSAGVSIKSLNWANAFSTSQFTYAGGSQNGRVPAGSWRFIDRKTNAVVATVTSNGNPRSGVDDGLVVVSANLPSANLETNGVWTNNALVTNNDMRELMEQVSVTKRTENMTFTLGGFLGYSDVSSLGTSGGRTVAPLVNNPEPYRITFTPATATDAPAGTTAAALAPLAGWNGQTIDITNQYGFANGGGGFGRNPADALQLAAFFGHNWKITDRINIDWGVRTETYSVKGQNTTSAINSRGNYDPTFGGADGNPLTMFDNRFFTETAAWDYDKSVDSFSWSFGTNLLINDHNSVYVRYTEGEKAPDLAFFRGYNSQFRLDNLVPRPQTIDQVELGYRFNWGNLNLIATPFWSRLGDVYDNPQATDTDGTAYYPDPIYNIITSYGVELEADYQFTEHLSVKAVYTWQESEGTNWKVFSAGNPGRADDRFIDLSGKPSDNNPDMMFTITPSYRTEKFNASLAWKYMGERAGNVANVIMLPGFHQADFNASYAFTPRFSVSVNVNNVFDTMGVMHWAGWGINSLDRQSFTSLPAGSDTTLLIVPSQPRSYYLSATYKF